MVREVREQDKDYISKIIGKEHHDVDVVNDFNNANKCFVYEDDSIKGFIFTKLYDKIENNWDIYLYVEPAVRNKGIGSSLYNEMILYLTKVKPNEIRIVFDKRKEIIKDFVEKRGFKKWYGLNLHQYDGPKIECEYLDIVPFEDKYFDQYFKMSQECFYQVRKDSNIEPYLIPDNQEHRDYKWAMRDRIYLLLNGIEIVATYSTDKKFIDDIMVSPKYQGKGYGKIIVQYATNHILSKGYYEVCLYCLDTNIKANNLYGSVGFHLLDEIQVYKKSGKDLF